MQPRKLTLSWSIRDHKPRHGHYCQQTVVPFLRVQGKWLEAAGFRVGDRVHVEVQPGRLIVTTEEER